jgi:outer membrane biosynthesis protein TonB
MADERDPKVSRSYREMGSEEPPRALDDAILAASRRAVSRKRSWYAPVALAATLVLVVAVTVQVERRKPEEERVAKAPEQPKPMNAPAQVQQERQFTPEPPPSREPPAPSAKSAAPVPVPVPAPAPQAAEPPRELAKSNEQAAGARSDAARDSASPAPAMRREARQMESKVETPEAALERIAELRRQGKQEEADKALAEFRRRYPGYVLSDEMKAKVERK